MNNTPASHESILYFITVFLIKLFWQYFTLLSRPLFFFILIVQFQFQLSHQSVCITKIVPMVRNRTWNGSSNCRSSYISSLQYMISAFLYWIMSAGSSVWVMFNAYNPWAFEVLCVPQGTNLKIQINESCFCVCPLSEFLWLPVPHVNSQTHTWTHTDTQTDRKTPRHTHTYAHSHIHTHKHTHTHTHKHTHTHTQFCGLSSVWTWHF